MKRYSNLFFISLVVVLISVACVPTRQFQELKDKNTRTVTERDSLLSLNEDMTVKNTEMAAEIEELKKKLEELAANKNELKDSANLYKKQYLLYKSMYDELTKNNNKNEKQRNKEVSLLLTELQQTKNDLQMQEDELRSLEDRLIKKGQELDERDKSLLAKSKEIAEKNKRLQELEQILHSKDSVTMALKNKITNALLGFEGKGLTIQQKNGKVYVTMDNKLLFKSGKWDVDVKGREALRQISKVMAKNTDINILVEGHTDDVAMRGTGDIKDNWDLSVKRATEIVKILLNKSTIDPKRITAAGRGPYFPIDKAKTKEARAKNRRTEIILTPKLDEIFRILESN